MEANWSNGEQCWKVAATSRRSNVATLGKPIQKSTTRNVATSQRRDVATSERQHGICTSSFKALMVQNWGHREAYERGHGIPEQQGHRFRRSARDLYCFSFLDIRMMFLRLNIFIFSFSMF